MKNKIYLKQLLELYWLRPETALWRTFDCLLMDGHTLSGRSIEFGCGDGMLSFIMAGGKINNYDVYEDLFDVAGFNNGVDIYNVVNDRDRILEKDSSLLRYYYSCGVDYKEALVAKAARTGDFYKKLLVHNLNGLLPIESNSYDSALSNILSWLGDLDCILREWNRVLNMSSKLYLFVPNYNFKEKAWLYYSAPHKGNNIYFNYFDRGYGSLIKHYYRSCDWEKIFVRSGFRVAQHVMYLTDPVMRIWNVGTRPISQLLIKMAASVLPKQKKAIKEEWVSYFYDFMLPIVQEEATKTPKDDEHAFHFYILEKDRCI